MSIQWGSKKNGVRIGAEATLSPANPTSATTKVNCSISIYIDRDVNISDSSNKLSYSGTAIPDGSTSNINVGGSGTKKIKTLSQYHTLSYGSSSTKSFSASMSGINYAGGTLTVSFSVKIPARPYALPANPTGLTATRISDNQVNLAWTNVSPTSSSAPYQSMYIERWDNVTDAWSTIATINTATAYTDTTTVANRQYIYKVKSANSSGKSSGVVSSTVTMTPGAPKDVTIARTPGTIVVTWTNTSPYQTAVQVDHLQNNASVDITTLGNVSTYTYNTVNDGTTHKFKVRAGFGDLYSAWVESPEYQLPNVPLAPGGLTATTPFDATETNVLNWVHNPVDGSTQTKYQIRYKKIADDSWTTSSAVTSANQYAIVPSLVNENTYELQVATAGMTGVFGPYSESFVIVATTRPTVTITSPVATIVTARLTVSWTYTDAGGTAQSGFRIYVRQAGQAVQTFSGTGAATSYELPIVLENQSSYQVRVQVWDGYGMPSLYEYSPENPMGPAFLVDFPEPPTPEVNATWRPVDGTVEIQVFVPPATEEQATPVYAQVFGMDEGKWRNIANHIAIPESQYQVNRTNLFPNPMLDAANLSMLTSARSGDTLSGTSIQPSAGEKARVGFSFYGNAYDSLPPVTGFEVTPGDTYTLSQYFTCTQAAAIGSDAQLYLRFHDGIGWIDEPETASVPITGGEDRVSHTFTVPVGAEYISWNVWIPTAVIWTTGTVSVAKVLLERRATLESYFDINTVVSAPYSIEWEDTPYFSDTLLLEELTNSGWATVVVDAIPRLNQSIPYRAVVWSSEGATATAYDYCDTTNVDSIYLSGGPGWSVRARLKGNASIDTSLNREKVLHTFAGRTKPIEFIGVEQSNILKLSGDVDGMDMDSDIGSWTSFVDVSNLPAPIAYRDPMGRRLFVSISDVSVTHDAKSNLIIKGTRVNVASIGATLTEVDYDES